MTIPEATTLMQQGTNLTSVEAEKVLGSILDDDSVTDADIASFLTALTEKGDTSEELTGFIVAMQSRMLPIHTDLDVIDTCGTGGDKSGTFNISTASALLVASTGIPVVKHGNRNASSQCGSADLLESLRIPIDLAPQQAIQRLKRDSFVFLFAQKYHPALKRLAQVRRSLGFPTVFNILGPLLNPASPKRQVIGTYNKLSAQKITSILQARHLEHAIVLYSEDGLDEASLSEITHINEIKHSDVISYDIQPADFDLEMAKISELQGGDANRNAAILQEAFSGFTDRPTATQRVIALNAGIALYVAGAEVSIADGVTEALHVLETDQVLHFIKRITEDV